MKKTINLCMVLITFSTVIYENALAWDNKVTHKDISEYAAYSSMLRKCTSEADQNCNYLIKIGFSKGLDKDELEWNENATIKKGYIKDWLREGAFLEDAGSTSDAVTGKARFTNHFHNPLKPWAIAGLTDLQSGESTLIWAQDSDKQRGSLGGDWS